jgi:hypothetical protein
MLVSSGGICIAHKLKMQAVHTETVATHLDFTVGHLHIAIATNNVKTDLDVNFFLGFSVLG